MRKFTTYIDCDVLVTFSYTETTMTKQRGRTARNLQTVDITPAQCSNLNDTPIDGWTQAASIFNAAARAAAPAVDADDEY